MGAAFGTFWLLITLLPIYYIVVTSLRPRDEYFTSNPLSLPTNPTLTAYREVLQAGFTSYLVNSVIVTVATVSVVVVLSLMTAYVIVHNRSALSRRTFEVLLLGIAIPIQATIVPVYYLIVKLGLYDTLLALILPSIAFAIPISVLILVNFVRDIPKELFESHANGRSVGVGDVVATGRTNDQTGHHHRRDLRRAYGLEWLPVPPHPHAEFGQAGAPACRCGRSRVPSRSTFPPS